MDDSSKHHSKRAANKADQLKFVCQLKSCMDPLMYQMKMQYYFIKQIYQLKEITDRLELESAIGKFNSEYKQFTKTSFENGMKDLDVRIDDLSINWHCLRTLPNPKEFVGRLEGCLIFTFNQLIFLVIFIGQIYDLINHPKSKSKWNSVLEKFDCDHSQYWKSDYVKSIVSSVYEKIKELFDSFDKDILQRSNVSFLDFDQLMVDICPNENENYFDYEEEHCEDQEVIPIFTSLDDLKLINRIPSDDFDVQSPSKRIAQGDSTQEF